MKYIIFSLAVALAGVPVGCWAQDQVTYATGELQDGLSHLRQSVEELVADNQRLTLQNNAMAQEAYQLQVQLSQEQRQEDIYNQTVVRLRGDNPRYAQQIFRLEKEGLDLEDRMQKTSQAIQLIQQALQAGYQESQRFPGQMDPMSTAPHPPEGSVLESRRQKEKLKLMKMIYDSQRRQDSLREAIGNYEKQAPWDDTQLAALEAQLKELEQNYGQLKGLLGQMGPQLKKSRMSVGQHVEQGQLENNINDLTRQERRLKADLEDLRSQMVDLDKRKSSLERLIKQQS